MEDIGNISSSTSNLTYTEWMDKLRFMFADNISGGPSGLGDGEDYNSNGGTQQEKSFDHGDATINDPFTCNFGNGTLNAGSHLDENSAKSWNSRGNQQVYVDRPQSYTSQMGHINVGIVAPSELQLVSNQHLPAQNSGDSSFAPQNYLSQVGHINVGIVAPSDLQLGPDQHLPAQNLGNSSFVAAAAATPAVAKHLCDKLILMTKKAISEHLRKEHGLKTRNSDVACGWQGCTWKKRGDTSVRHFMEVHLGINGARCSRCFAYFKSRNCRELKEHRKEGECRKAKILYPENGGEKVRCKYIVCEEIVDPINTVQLV
ncbi:hypothetical protein BJ138DRAFT_1167382 [Hygrophoropsis aurantiaca]|uniref:Uncharacterized protein n=1 Tax=Hygrophoropsis aurantiaca TaxID=72124 RepID=A0ACB7ZSU4_9AGAM|nr:hypothetical protein BJ138DRAFT_1167382 [Hygrophoropsis aurantiaca]